MADEPNPTLPPTPAPAEQPAEPPRRGRPPGTGRPINSRKKRMWLGFANFKKDVADMVLNDEAADAAIKASNKRVALLAFRGLSDALEVLNDPNADSNAKKEACLWTEKFEKAIEMTAKHAFIMAQIEGGEPLPPLNPANPMKDVSPGKVQPKRLSVPDFERKFAEQREAYTGVRELPPPQITTPYPASRPTNGKPQ